MTIILRQYQDDLTDRIRAAVIELTMGSKPRRVIAQAETGSGKMVIGCNFLRLCHEKGLRGLYVARGRELVKQASGTLKAMGVRHGILMAGQPYNADRILVASKDTLFSRAIAGQRLLLPPADLLVIDEAHESLASSWQKILQRYESSTVLGLTATPARSDGRGLGGYWQLMASCVPPSELIRQGHIVPTRVFAPYQPKLKGLVKGENGEWSGKSAAKLMDKPTLVGDAVGQWKRHAGGMATVVYCCTVEHSLHVREEFLKAGIKCAHVSGDTDSDERDDAIEAFKVGGIDVLTNVFVFKQGVDLPRAAVCQLLRPLRSLVFYRQAVGRVKRPYPGKEECLLIDHGGAVFVHGHPDQDIDWQLEEGKRIEDLREQKKQEGKEKPQLCCPKCHAVFSGSNVCPACKTILSRQGKQKVSENGTLVEVAKTLEVQATPHEKERYWRVCLGVQARRGASCGAAAQMYRSRFKEWPDGSFRDFPHGGQWKQKVAEVFPGYVREKAG